MTHGGGSRRVLLGFATALLVVAGSAPVVATVAAPPARAQAAGDPATDPCFPGAPARTSDTRNGPSPVGRCEPTSGQRAVDNLVWLWVVLLLAVGTGVAVRWLLRGSDLDREGAGVIPGSAAPDDPGGGGSAPP